MTTPQPCGEAGTAAAYLGGEMFAAARVEFEAHLLACDTCWAEVNAVRGGRALAEELREAAPQELRERLRAIATGGSDSAPVPNIAMPGMRPRYRRPRHRVTVALAVAMAAVVVVLGAGLSLITAGPRDTDPALLAAASAYRSEGSGSVPVQAPPPARVLADMTWQGTTARLLAGQPALAHRYANPAGHGVLLVSSPVHFPRPANAEAIAATRSGWIASVDGVQILGADRDGLSWLVICAARETALAAGRAAGLV
ncbi:MAG: anti-sigma factor family protein [Sporichthyaceae bacterium]